jgi:hypothetical protein
MTTFKVDGFKVGDLLRFKKDSWWLKRSTPHREPSNFDSLVLVTDSIESSKRFFYGRVCSTGETHLWSHDQFDLVQKAGG